MKKENTFETEADILKSVGQELKYDPTDFDTDEEATELALAAESLGSLKEDLGEWAEVDVSGLM